LRQHPEHRETRAAVELLDDSSALEKIGASVRTARTALLELTSGGYPVVYAVRVDLEWFDNWDSIHLPTRKTYTGVHALTLYR
jgi:hypothetical protein